MTIYDARPSGKCGIYCSHCGETVYSGQSLIGHTMSVLPDGRAQWVNSAGVIVHVCRAS